MSNAPHSAESAGGLTEAGILQLGMKESPAINGPWGHTPYSKLNLTKCNKTQLCVKLKGMSGFHLAKECDYVEQELGTHFSPVPTPKPKSQPIPLTMYSPGTTETQLSSEKVMT